MVNVGDVFDMLTVTEQQGSKWLAECKCGVVVGPYHGSKMMVSHSCRACYHSKRLPERTRKSGTHNASKKVFWNYRGAAKRRGISFELTYEQFMDSVVDPCTYCNRTNTSYFNAVDDWEEKFEYTGLDRVDSSVGYRIDNIVPCCKICNMAKSNMTVQEFYQWAMAVNTNLSNVSEFIQWWDETFEPVAVNLDD